MAAEKEESMLSSNKQVPVRLSGSNWSSLNTCVYETLNGLSRFFVHAFTHTCMCVYVCVVYVHRVYEYMHIYICTQRPEGDVCYPSRSSSALILDTVFQKTEAMLAAGKP